MFHKNLLPPSSVSNSKPSKNYIALQPRALYTKHTNTFYKNAISVIITRNTYQYSLCYECAQKTMDIDWSQNWEGDGSEVSPYFLPYTT